MLGQNKIFSLPSQHNSESKQIGTEESIPGSLKQNVTHIYDNLFDI